MGRGGSSHARRVGRGVGKTGQDKDGKVGEVGDGGGGAAEQGDPPSAKNVGKGLSDHTTTSLKKTSEDSSSGDSESSEGSDNSFSDSNESKEVVEPVPEQSEEVSKARRLWKRNYCLTSRARWEREGLDEETWWKFGADSNCSFLL